MTEADKELKKTLRRINARIAKIAKEIGTNTPYYRAFEDPMLSTSNGRLGSMVQSGAIVVEKGKPVRFSLSQKAINIIGRDKDAKKWLSKFEAMPTYGELAERAVKRFSDNPNIDISKMSPADRKAVAKQYLNWERDIREMFDNVMADLYDARGVLGEEDEIFDIIRKSSRGRWSTNEFYETSTKAIKEYLEKLKTDERYIRKLGEEKITERKSIVEKAEAKGYYDSPFRKG